MGCENVSDGVLKELDEALSELEEVGSLSIRRADTLVSLNFLKKLKRITGRTLVDKWVRTPASLETRKSAVNLVNNHYHSGSSILWPTYSVKCQRHILVRNVASTPHTMSETSQTHQWRYISWVGVASGFVYHSNKVCLNRLHPLEGMWKHNLVQEHAYCLMYVHCTPYAVVEIWQIHLFYTQAFTVQGSSAEMGSVFLFNHRENGRKGGTRKQNPLHPWIYLHTNRCIWLISAHWEGAKVQFGT